MESDSTSVPAEPSDKLRVGAEELPQWVEAALLSTDKPLSGAKLAERFDGVGPGDIRQAVLTLNELYEQSGRSFRVEAIAGGWQILTRPEFDPLVSRLTNARQGPAKLSPAAVETLAVIAYRQPVIRSEIETVRGVASGEVIRTLIDLDLVRVSGRSEQPGRPLMYATTKQFLAVFGLESLKDLPRADELKHPAESEPPESGESQPEQESASAPTADAADAADTESHENPSADDPAAPPT